MATAHGSVAKLYANGYDLSAYMRTATFAGTADVADTTVWGLGSKTYIPGFSDATLTGEGIYDADMAPGLANKPDDVLAAALGNATKSNITYLPRGDSLGARARLLRADETSYEITSPRDDISAVSFEAQSSTGAAASAVVLRPLAGALTLTTTGAGTAVSDEVLDTPVATTFGGLAVLQVVSKGGGAGNLTVLVESSVNGSTGWGTIATFATVTAAPGSEVVVIPSGTTINIYVRASWTVTGGTWDINVAFGRRYG